MSDIPESIVFVNKRKSSINEVSSIVEHHSYGADKKTEHVPLAPEVIGHIGSVPITNTLINSFLVTFLLSITAIILSKKINAIPGKFQALIEIIVEYIYQLSEQLAHEKVTVFFPWVMTFFLYILVANLIGLLPGMSTIGLIETMGGQQKFTPIFRPINSDLNMTLALALLSVFITHYYAIRFLGIWSYLKKWFSLKMFGVFMFVGLLELVAEFTKIVSLSFRLFGNILSGKVLIKTSLSISAFLLPLPFYVLELLVSVVQAAVFMLLTLVFMVILSNKHEN